MISSIFNLSFDQTVFVLLVAVGVYKFPVPGVYSLPSSVSPVLSSLLSTATVSTPVASFIA